MLEQEGWWQKKVWEDIVELVEEEVDVVGAPMENKLGVNESVFDDAPQDAPQNREPMSNRDPLCSWAAAPV